MALPLLLRRRSFTLIELLVVMGVIAILAAITLGAAGYVNRRAAASRAKAEIAAMEAGLERYKVDNGIYPTTTNTPAYAPGGVASRTLAPSVLANSAITLYESLSGKTNGVYTSLATAPIYMEFKATQISSTNATAGVQDPFGYPYGYVCDAPGATVTNVIFNIGFFDLWSTGGQTGTGSSTNTGQWLTNWQGN